MTDMPGTIWAAKSGFSSATMWWPDDAAGAGTAYRRTDLPPSREQVEAMVKPLEWGSSSFDPICAIHSLGRYDIWINESSGTFDLYNTSTREFVLIECTLEEAKAAAQADHTRRILAALGYEGEA